MFIAEILSSLHQGDFARNCLDMLKASHRHIINTRPKLNHWQSLSDLTSEDMEDITTAFYELVRSAARLIFTTANYGSWQRDAQPQAEDFIKLILPSPETSDIATRLKIDFERKEMSDRTSYLLSKIGDITTRHANGIKVNPESICAELQQVSCPLDSKTMFLQYLTNHIADGNWQKLSCCLNQKSAGIRRWKLLGLEYAQCQYSDGVEYSSCENLYLSLQKQIGTEGDIIAGCVNGKISPLTFRTMLKPYILIEPKTDQKIGMWEIHCMVKNIINGKTNRDQIRTLEVHKIHRMELYND